MGATTSVACALLVVLIGAHLRITQSHGWMQVPASRNFLANGKNNFYDRMSLDFGGGDGICGGAYSGDTRFSANTNGIFAPGSVPAGNTFTAGQTINMMINITAYHWGKFEFRLCPLSDPSLATEVKQLNESCLAQYQLQRADGCGRYTYLENYQMSYIVPYVLSAGVTCARCVLQWRWVTGNSCFAPGTDPAFVNSYSPGLPACDPATYLNPANNPPEKFWNCADIQITPATGTAKSKAKGDSTSPPFTQVPGDSARPCHGGVVPPPPPPPTPAPVTTVAPPRPPNAPPTPSPTPAPTTVVTAGGNSLLGIVATFNTQWGNPVVTQYAMDIKNIGTKGIVGFKLQPAVPIYGYWNLNYNKTSNVFTLPNWVTLLKPGESVQNAGIQFVGNNPSLTVLSVQLATS